MTQRRKSIREMESLEAETCLQNSGIHSFITLPLSDGRQVIICAVCSKIASVLNPIYNNFNTNLLFPSIAPAFSGYNTLVSDQLTPVPNFQIVTTDCSTYPYPVSGLN